jgi:hypothetical protein
VKLQYEEIGLPTEGGVYACRIDDPRGSGLVIDIFLQWFHGRWWHLFSDQHFRGEVHGWIGPLPRMRPLRANVEAPEE